MSRNQEIYVVILVDHKLSHKLNLKIKKDWNLEIVSGTRWSIILVENKIN